MPWLINISQSHSTQLEVFLYALLVFILFVNEKLYLTIKPNHTAYKHHWLGFVLISMFFVNQDELLASVKTIKFIKRKQDKEIKITTKIRLLSGWPRIGEFTGGNKKQNKTKNCMLFMVYETHTSGHLHRHPPSSSRQVLNHLQTCMWLRVGSRKLATGSR